jgi:SAM-dependent methyltransferase
VVERRAALLLLGLAGCGGAAVPDGMVTVPGGMVRPWPGGPELELAAFHMDRGPAAGPEGEPVVSISALEAAERCGARGARLPTDAEWSLAASRELGEAPVGLEGLAGVVFQHTLSRFEPASSRERILGMPGDLQVLRGSCCPFVEAWSQPDHRAVFAVSQRSSFVGYRCVRPVDPADPNLALDGRLAVPHSALDVQQPVRLLLEGVFGPDREPLAPPARAFIDALPPGARVADVGCGLGQLSLDLAERVGPTGRVWAVDIDADVLAFLQGWADARGLEQLVTHRSADDDVQLPAASLDAVFLFRMLNTLRGVRPEQLEGLLSSVVDSLGPGGALVLVDDVRPGAQPPLIERLRGLGLEQERAERSPDPRGREGTEEVLWVLRKGPTGS